jgi:general stress protein 26
MSTIKKALAVINDAPAAILTTFNAEGYPESRALLNLRNPAQFPALAPKIAALDDGMTFLFSTNTSSSKIGQLKADCRVSLYYCQAESFLGVWLSGDMVFADDPSVREFLWQPGWEIYYPGGVHDPDHTVLRFRPRRLRMYENLSVAEWRQEEGM